MAAANTDKLRKKKSNFSTTLSSGITDADTTIPLSSASGLATDTAITLTIDRVDANGVSTPSAVERVTGVVSGNNLTNCLRAQDGTSAAAHSSGAVVEDIWDADTWNDLCDAFLEEHDQAGDHNFTIIEDVNGNEAMEFGVTASAVNHIKVTNAATGNNPIIASAGEADTGIDFENSEGEEGLIIDFNATAVNEVTIDNAATGADPTIAATGDDADIHLAVTGKGTGGVKLGTGTTSITDVLDEDDMASDSATALATQQSIKKYVDDNTSSAKDVIVRAGMSASDQTLTNAAQWYTVVFDSETLDTGSDFASNTFTAPENGYYKVSAMVTWATTNVSDGSIFYVRIAVGGSTKVRYQHVASAATKAFSVHVDDILNLTASNTVTIDAQSVNDAGTVLTSDIYLNYVTVHQIV